MLTGVPSQTSRTDIQCTFRIYSSICLCFTGSFHIASEHIKLFCPRVLYKINHICKGTWKYWCTKMEKHLRDNNNKKQTVMVKDGEINADYKPLTWKLYAKLSVQDAQGVACILKIRDLLLIFCIMESWWNCFVVTRDARFYSRNEKL